MKTRDQNCYQDIKDLTVYIINEEYEKILHLLAHNQQMRENHVVRSMLAARLPQLEYQKIYVD